jgi:hypothetical protein
LEILPERLSEHEHDNEHHYKGFALTWCNYSEIWRRISPRSSSNAWLPQPDRIRHRNSEREYLVRLGVGNTGGASFDKGDQVARSTLNAQNILL